MLEFNIVNINLKKKQLYYLLFVRILFTCDGPLICWKWNFKELCTIGYNRKRGYNQAMFHQTVKLCLPCHRTKKLKFDD